MTASLRSGARHLMWLGLLLTLSACTTLQPDALQPMSVLRDPTALPKPGVRFGAYAVKGLRYEPQVTLSGSVVTRQQGGQFELHQAGKAQAKVRLLGRTQYSIHDPLEWLGDLPAAAGANNRRLMVLRSAFRKVSEPEWFFRAEVFPSDGSGAWLVVWRPAAAAGAEAEAAVQVLGMITGPQGEVWPLRQRGGLHEAVLAERVVASLSPTPQQQVWLADDLPAVQQHVLAAWASALMLPPLQ